MTDFHVECCFCGDEIETFCNVVPLTLNLPAGGTQELWAHLTCLHAHLHQSALRAAFGNEEATAETNDSPALLSN